RLWPASLDSPPGLACFGPNRCCAGGRTVRMPWAAGAPNPSAMRDMRPAGCRPFSWPLAVGLLLAAVAPGTLRAQATDGYLDFSTEALPGRLYVPPADGTTDDRRPLILALHGAGGI